MSAKVPFPRWCIRAALAAALLLPCLPIAPARADVYVEPDEIDIQDGLDRVRMLRTRGDERAALQELLKVVDAYPQGLCIPPGESRYVPLVEYVQACIAAAPEEARGWYRLAVRGPSRQILEEARAGTVTPERLRYASDVYRYSEAGAALLALWAERCWERGWLAQATKAWDVLAAHPEAAGPARSAGAYRARVARALAGSGPMPDAPPEGIRAGSERFGPASIGGRLPALPAPPPADGAWLRPGGGDDGTRLMEGSVTLLKPEYEWRSGGGRSDGITGRAVGPGRRRAIPVEGGGFFSAWQSIVSGGQVILSGPRDLQAYDLVTGKLAWGHALPGVLGGEIPGGWVHGLASDGERVAYVARRPGAQAPRFGTSTGAGRLLLVRPVRRAQEVGVRFEKDAELLWEAHPGEAASNAHSFEGTPIVTPEAVYCAAFEEQGRVLVHAFATSDGHLLWSRFICQAYVQPGVPGAQPSLALSEGVLYVVTHRRVVAAVDALDGSPLWISVYEAAEGETDAATVSCASGLLVRDGCLYAAPGDTRELLCLDAATGRKCWGWAEPPVANVPPGTRLLLGCVEGFLYVLVVPAAEGGTFPSARICVIDLSRPADRAPFVLLPSDAGSLSGRPALTRERLLIPTRGKGIVSIDIRIAGRMPTLKQVESPVLAWPADVGSVALADGVSMPFQGGNLTVVPGSLLVVNDGVVLLYRTVEDVAAHLRAQIALDPAQPDPYLRLAAYLRSRKDPEGALAVLREALCAVPEEAREPARVDLALAIHRRGLERRDALEAPGAFLPLLEEALSLRPGSYEIGSDVAAAYEAAGRMRDAYSLLEGLLDRQSLTEGALALSSERRRAAWVVGDRLAGLYAACPERDRRVLREGMLLRTRSWGSDGAVVPATGLAAVPVLWSDAEALREAVGFLEGDGRSAAARHILYVAAARGSDRTVREWASERLRAADALPGLPAPVAWSAARRRPPRVAWMLPVVEGRVSLMPVLDAGFRAPGDAVALTSGEVVRSTSAEAPRRLAGPIPSYWAVQGSGGIWRGIPGGMRLGGADAGVLWENGAAAGEVRPARFDLPGWVVREDSPPAVWMPEVALVPGTLFAIEPTAGRMRVVALDVAGGDWIWVQEGIPGAAGITTAAPGTVSPGRLVVWSSVPDRVSVLDARTGTVLESSGPTDGSGFRSGPVAFDGGAHVVATSSGLWRFAADPAGWECLHRFPAPLATGETCSLARDPGNGALWCVTAGWALRVPCGPDGRVPAGEGGPEPWRKDLAALKRLEGVRIEGGRLLRIGEIDHGVRFEAFDLGRDLATDWRIDFPPTQSLRGALLLPGGLLVVESGRDWYPGDAGNFLVGFELAGGRTLWRLPLDPYLGRIRALAYVGGRILVEGNGGIVCLEPAE
ncbi:MAG: PQQ-binding-like beta-propeller repeat protein [Planctomycetes bacterium]|nr:PQQ-binding-like beta-propeller repeat protein [Planctomycetota bacterium]